MSQSVAGTEDGAPEVWPLSLPADTRRLRWPQLKKRKAEGTPLVMITAYDALTAPIFDAAMVDLLLVGDSYGNVMLAHGSTIPTTLDEMVLATRSVVRGTRRALVVADLPFGSYEASPQQALQSACRLMKEGGAQAVKLEGGHRVAAQVKLLVESGIPVVGHLGFTPQSEHALGGFKVQGRGQDGAEKLLADALELEQAGVSALVLEMVPADVATLISQRLQIPTIGIGAGNGCDGQVLVWSDLAGMTEWNPKFVKVFAQIGQLLSSAVREYASCVRDRSFPGPEHTFTN